MKKTSILFSALCAISLVGCVNTSGTRVLVDLESGEATIREDNMRLANRLKVTNVSYGEVTEGIRRATVSLESTTDKKLSFQGRMVWYDAEGMEIDPDGKSYRSYVLDGHDTCTMTGVAPNAQLAIMKVFSDMTSGAKTSWLIAALEDCMNLDVDVINMSLGSSCGFSTQDDKKNIEDIY